MKTFNDSAAARPPRTAFKVTLIYILVSGIWILASDRLLEALISDHALYADLSIVKGWLFVAVTAVLLYSLIERDARQQWYTNVALRESETRFKTIIDNIPLGVGESDLTKDPSPILYTNKKYAEMFGYPLEDVPFVEAWMSKAYPDEVYRQQVMEWWNRDIQLVRGKTPAHSATRAYQITCQDGSTRAVEITFSIVGERLYAIFNDVTQRQRDAEALRAGEEKYRLLFENMTAGFALHEIICDQQGQPQDYRFLEINPAFEKLTGIAVNTLLGRTIKDVVPSTEPYWIDTYGRVALTGEPIAYENYFGESGRYFDAWAFSPRRNQFAVIFTDITKRKQAEEALQQSAERLAILHEIDQAILSAQSITAIAEATLSHFQQILPQRDSQVILFEAFEAIVIACYRDGSTVATGKRVPREHLGPAIALPQGQIHIVHDLLQLIAPSPGEREMLEAGARSSLDVPLVVLGESIGLLRLSSAEPEAFPDELIEVAREVADQLAVAIQNARLLEQAQRHAKELEARVAERTRELAEANEQLTELDRLKSKFVSDVSHELRTPIANLKLYIDLLGHGQVDKQAQYIATLQQQIRRVADLVDDILDLSRLERRKQQGIILEKVQLNDVAAQVITAYQPRAEASALTLSFMPQADLPPAYGDANQLAQVVTNLIANALNYTRQGTVQVKTVERDDQVGLQVVDTGRGIAPEDLPHIFERFYRGRHIRLADVPGTGLGLAIVKEIVDIHHGRIEVESQPGGGTTFYVWLPVYRPAAAAD